MTSKSFVNLSSIDNTQTCRLIILFKQFSCRIPRRPPFTAYIANLPYDVDEGQVQEVFERARLKVGHHEDWDDHDEDSRVLWDHDDNEDGKGVRYIKAQGCWSRGKILKTWFLTFDLDHPSAADEGRGWTSERLWICRLWRQGQSGELENFHQLLIFKVHNLTESNKDESALKTECYPDRRPFNDWLGREQPEDEDWPCQPGNKM